MLLLTRSRNRFIWILFLIVLSWECVAQEDQTSIAIINARVIDGSGAPPIENATIIISNDEVTCLGTCEIPEKVKIINAASKFIIPALIDLHVHYSMGGWLDSFPIPGLIPDVSERYPYEEVVKKLKNHPERIHQSYLCSGVTTIFDTGGYPWLFDVRKTAMNSIKAPRFYTTGPLLSFEKQILPHPIAEEIVFNINEEEGLDKGLAFLKKAEPDGINIHNIHNAPNHQVLRERIEKIVFEYKDTSTRIMAFSKGLEEAKLAIELGVEALIYSIEDEVVDDEFLQLAVEHDITYIPTLGVADAIVNAQVGHISGPLKSSKCLDVSLEEKIESTEKYYTHEIEVGSGRTNIIPDPKFAATRNDNLTKIQEAGIRIALGSSAGVPFLFHGPATHYEMKEMVKAGLSPMQVIVAASKHGAHVIGNERLGVLQAGNLADMVLLNKNPLDDIDNVRDIEMVIYKGQIIN
ncbi:amidohydrolase family protein [Zeaxanthinibacter sp. PT1]|uniref:amidohydrolase family protein n=1 Tax=Zeaxanthinibacter TaxID=561554 RepID=UPI00234952F1|nr:amidohydrolase family protein [Zeaxanthinibacter sp. PT1]MDC6351961.1 amidohydrolase family protein [Zeaxanthinibacter sp. PT1]